MSSNSQACATACLSHWSVPQLFVLILRTMRNGTGSALGPTPDAGPSGALSIFTPPSSSEVPEALQGVISPQSRIQSVDMNGHTNGHSSANGHGIGNGTGNISAGPSTNSRELRVRLMIPNSAESGTQTPTAEASTRLRPTRGRESMQRTGVSASGHGVKVGGSARPITPSTGNSMTRKKGVQTPETVCYVMPTNPASRLITREGS